MIGRIENAAVDGQAGCLGDWLGVEELSFCRGSLVVGLGEEGGDFGGGEAWWEGHPIMQFVVDGYMDGVCV